jgi:hypothetical protein
VRLFSCITIPTKSPMRGPAALMTAACALIVAACSGPGSSFAPLSAAAQKVRPSVGSSPTPTPIPFVFQNVDNPNSHRNQVNGINQLSKIVGTYGGGQGSNIDESYTAQPPFVQFRPLNIAGSQGTVATSLSSNKLQAGYVINPAYLNGIWGFVRVGAIPTLVSDPNEGTGNNAITEIWGINDSQFAVGFYTNSSGVDVPFEVNVPTLSYTDLHPPGAIQAQATGIDGKGNIAGWETTSNGTVGFFLKAGTYYTFTYPGAQKTYALSLNWSDQIVGAYVDANGATHGFLLTGPTKGGASQIWQSIDAPTATGGTWVTGINNHHVICGYYIDSYAVQHGFIANP